MAVDGTGSVEQGRRSSWWSRHTESFRVASQASSRDFGANSMRGHMRDSGHGVELTQSSTSRSSRTSHHSVRSTTRNSELEVLEHSATSAEMPDWMASKWWHESARFLLHTTVHLATTVLRIISLIIYYRYHEDQIFYVQAAIGTLGILASVHITTQDSDVKRWASGGSSCWYCLFWTMSLLCLGVCQLIYVKRAWARRLQVAEVLQPDSDDEDGAERTLFLHESPSWAGPAVGGEKMLPVALLLGMPFALVSSYAYLGLEHDELDSQLLLCAAVSAVTIVTLGVVDVDLAVSTYVAHRYHFDPRRRGTRAGRTQCCYPAIHFLFRLSEVIMRTTLLTQLLIIAREIILSDWLLLCIALAMVIVDVLVSAIVLRIHSPREEYWFVHLLVAYLLLMGNITCFVDMPGFCYPARLISRWLDCWRFFQLAALVGLVLGGFSPGIASQVWVENIGDKEELSLGYGTVAMVVATVFHYTLRCTPVITKRGDDLHTAVWRGLTHRVEKLLGAVRAGTAGEALDVNGRTKDGLEVTPAMIAADGGRAEILELLVRRGARVDDKDLRSRTCLHYAAANVHLECLRILSRTTKGQRILRSSHAELLSLAERRAARLQQDGQAELVSLLSPRRQPAAEDCGVRSVRAPFVSSRRLGALFPHANAEEDAPSLRELKSVSGLLVAHATGPLARPLLAPPRAADNAAGAVSIDQLRRGGLLGQGAAGKVIEVEVKDDSSMPLGGFHRVLSTRTSILSMSTLIVDQSGRSDEAPTPRRFALKLQTKKSSQQAHSELVALQRASHPFIVRLEHAFQTAHHFALLLEWCPGGDINRLLCSAVEEGQTPGGLPPAQAARYGGQVLLALIYLHVSLGFVYRDVKPENMLVSSRDQAKLADFGLALHVGEKKRKHLQIEGTPGFLAPELIYGDDAQLVDDGKLDPFKTDAYSYGVSLQLMLLGRETGEFVQDERGKWMLPRTPESDAEMVKLLEHQQELGHLSQEAVDLLKVLLPRQPGQRQHLREVGEHPFFLKALQCKGTLHDMLMPPSAQRLRCLS